MVVGICKLTLYLPMCHSLKEKRGVIRKLKERTANRFKVPVSEVGANDRWQSAELGFAIVGNDRRMIEGLIQKISDHVEMLGLAQIVDQYSEIINV